MVIESAKKALSIRYMLLAFIYTHMAKAHVNGTPAVRSLAMNYPRDRTTFTIDRQFMWGSELMVVPALDSPSQANLAMGYQDYEAYFPKDTWYDFHQETVTTPLVGPTFSSVRAPLTQIPLFIRGGSIIPMQENEATTYARYYLLKSTMPCFSSAYFLLIKI